MGLAPGLLPGPDSGPGSRTPTAQELEDLRAAAVRTVRAMGASPEDAEDAAQEALYILWRRTETVDQPEPYLRRVARNVFLHMATRRRDQPLAPDELTPLLDLIDHRAGYTLLDDYLAEVDQVRGWVSGLPPEQAEVVKLWMEGLMLPEIASRLQISESEARSRWLTARKKIKAAVFAEMVEDHLEQPSVHRRANQVTRLPAAVSPGREETDLAELPRQQTDLAELPPRQQQVLRLIREGYKPAQIARVLGISPNTVRVNLFHARKRLRQDTRAA
jgi:RNA polymerase sigma factor (sigma-70 family)